MTGALLIFGSVTAFVFVAVLLMLGQGRAGYDAVYHTGSELMLGHRGWIQRVSFLQFGVGMVVFAVGVNQALNSVIGTVLFAIVGLGSIISGAFLPDPIRGYPPEAPRGNSDGVSWQHNVHNAAGPIMFLANFGACLALASRLEGAWQLYTILTAVVGFALTVATAIAWQRDAARTGLIQRALIVVYLAWIALLGIHLATTPPYA